MDSKNRSETYDNQREKDRIKERDKDREESEMDR